MNNTTYLTEKKFTEFDLHKSLLQALAELKYDFCTPIQAKTLPYSLKGNDIVAQGQTGTGKTLAFLLATLNFLLQNEPKNKNEKIFPRALIIAPTRELVVQIHKDAESLTKFTDLKLGLAYGGDGYNKQVKTLSLGIDILVATTGRLIDYVQQGLMNFSNIQIVVLDEADRMFDLGFIKDIRWIFNQLPPREERLTLLFSATLSHRIREISFEYMNEPKYIECEPEQKTAVLIREELFYPSNEHKMQLLQTLLEEDWPDRCIIFANTKQTCDRIFAHLKADRIRAGLLTGDVPQKKRLQTLDDFTNGNLDVLVATDVAARGLHIPDVTLVINYDLPDDYKDYVHRIGRTGRAGKKGLSISFACEKYAINLTAIEEYIGHSIPVVNYNSDYLLKNLPQPKNRKLHPPNRRLFQKTKS